MVAGLWVHLMEAVSTDDGAFSMCRGKGKMCVRCSRLVRLHLMASQSSLLKSFLNLSWSRVSPLGLKFLMVRTPCRMWAIKSNMVLTQAKGERIMLVLKPASMVLAIVW
jgi:hypothetical protein